MKTKQLILTLLFCTLTLVSCKKDEDYDIGQFDCDKEMLFGTWKITHAAGIPWRYETTTATFYSDGKYSGRGYFGNGNGTYKTSGSKIICYIDGVEYATCYVSTLSGAECSLLMSQGASSITLKCKKI